MKPNKNQRLEEMEVCACEQGYFKLMNIGDGEKYYLDLTDFMTIQDILRGEE